MKRSCVILVVEDDPDQHLLIGYSLRTSLPEIKPIFTNTIDEALRYLYTCSSEKKACPQLVFLSMHPCQRESDWQLLRELRTRYPRLPVLVLSASCDPDFIKRTYDVGANSFVVKPHNLEGWEIQFKILSLYWFGTVTLPPTY